jgi:peptidoglycan/xylan/chitin deacetylase (PgdA/CDA1 family)
MHQYWKAIGCLAAAMALLTACKSVDNPEEIAMLDDKSDAVMAMAMETTTTVPETTTTTTTTTTTDLYAPFIDFDADIDPNKPMVALTFDDGPSENTPTILDALEENNAHATFFVVGECINNTTGEYIKRAASLGCEIGSHTYDHSNLTSLTTQERADIVKKTDDAVFDLIGRYPHWLRPPYGAYDDAVQLEIDKPLAFWSIDTRDWETRNTVSTVNNIYTWVEDGDIILMHDLYAETAAAAEQVIPGLIEQGYQLVTLSEMAYYRDFDPGSGDVVMDMHPDEPYYVARPDSATTTTNTDVTEETTTESVTVVVPDAVEGYMS